MHSAKHAQSHVTDRDHAIKADQTRAVAVDRTIAMATGVARATAVATSGHPVDATVESASTARADESAVASAQNRTETTDTTQKTASAAL